VTFDDLSNPTAGATIDTLLNGNEGYSSLDNLTVDRFGNIITNIPAHTFESWMGGNRVLVTVGRLSLDSIGRTFSDVAQGSAVAFVGSSGHLEIAVNLGRASDRLGVSGDRVVGIEVEVRKIT